MESLNWIWLQCALGVGNAAADMVLERELRPEQLLNASEHELAGLECFTPLQIQKMKNVSLKTAQNILARCERLGIWVLTPDDENYPERFLNIYQSPLAIYGVGDQTALSHDLMITMVGTRNATPLGMYAAQDIAHDLAKYGFGVVSGLAVGIDSYSHRGAMDGGGITVGIAGCGLDINYPTPNEALRREIASKGAIISEYPPGTEPTPTHFPVRNRLLSGLSLGTIVVEAPSRSGSLITAELALQQGRDVFVVPTDLYNKKGSGNFKLIRQGAKTLTCSEDVVEEYFIRYGEKITATPIRSQLEIRRSKALTEQGEKPANPPKQKAEQPKQPQLPQKEQNEIAQSLGDPQRAVYECLCQKTYRIEELVDQCGLSMQEMLAIVSELEIYGLIQAYPGKKFGSASLPEESV